MLWFHCSVQKCFIQMAQGSFEIILIIMGLLVSSAPSLGMFVHGRGDPVHPPPGSPDRPIPPDDYFEGSALRDNNIPTYAYDNYFMAKGDNAMPRGGHMMPYDTLKKYAVLPNGYPIIPLRSPTDNMTQGSRTAPTIQQLDFSYCDVFLEAPVSPPGNQIPWFCICTQCKGGPVGPKGDKGPQGSPGSQQKRGMGGFPGQPGIRGHRGLKGLKGDDGEKGDHGQLGNVGQKGLKGFKGDKGDMGVDGNPGYQGLHGKRGECPAICYSVEGPQGEPGPNGIVGKRGFPGVQESPGPKGQKGELGNIGPPGALGLNGQKGDQGEQGECHCRDGVDGANGPIGPPGEKGSKGDSGHQGAAGVNGYKGQKGDFGETGAPGFCSPAIESAFLAGLRKNYPVPDLPVPFTNVIYNRGIHFDALRGVYKAPVNGTYVMNYHLVIFSKPLIVGLFYNFNPIVKSTGSTGFGTSQQVILHLIRGDEVWLQVKDANSNGMYASSEYSSTFSGFLLYPDSCDMPMSHELPVRNNGTYRWGKL